MAFSIPSFRGPTALLFAATALVAVVAVSLSAIARAPEFTPVSANPSISIDANRFEAG